MGNRLTEAAVTKRIKVNGQEHDVSSDPGTPLLYVLRNELRLRGPKFGCGLAQCGACTVHYAGEAMRSCVFPLGSVEEEVTTVEGLGSPENPHPLQEAFISAQAAQCGYCINGMIMTAAALLKKVPNPTESQIREALDNNLCRCGTHMRIIKAVKRAAGGVK
jgi:nicotinate dehydrogenase subunit A